MLSLFTFVLEVLGEFDGSESLSSPTVDVISFWASESYSMFIHATFVKILLFLACAVYTTLHC